MESPGHNQRLKQFHGWLILALFLGCGLARAEDTRQPAPKRFRLAIVDSYHREYLWSQETLAGACAAMLEHKLLDNEAQFQELAAKDATESKRATIVRFWMDTKRKSSRNEVAESARLAMKAVDAFKPELLLLGDDNAINLLGNIYMDTTLPVVFWGLDGYPKKYNLIDSVEKPGHNITGVYQPGYPLECIEFLRQLAPGVRKIAVLGDESETARAKAKQLLKLAEDKQLPVSIEACVLTDSYARWQEEALALAAKVDAFYVVNHNTLKHADGKPVDHLEAGAWYLKHIRKPEVTHGGHFVAEGLLCTADDSGWKQGHAAMQIAASILEQGRKPAETPVIAPTRGKLLLNSVRARMLNLDASVLKHPSVEALIESSLALEKYPERQP